MFGKTRRRGTLIGLVAAAALGVAPSAFGAETAGERRSAPPTKTVTAAELAQAQQTPIEQIMRESEALATPDAAGFAGTAIPEGPEGPELTIDGEATATAGAAPGEDVFSMAQNGLWTGSFNSNPNRQVGKLYFDRLRGPGESWGHCTATVVNSENKSLLVTAGHCVYNPDPDKDGDGYGDGYIEGDGFWYENVQFCPGYEYGCKLGVWYARQFSTTSSWFYGTGNPRLYDWTDDMAVVLLNPHPTKGKIANSVGSQGIQFNTYTGLNRHSFGYPAADWRFPEYSYNGEDLIYCPGQDSYDGLGHVIIACTMTGGASGGPWITSPNASWIGYVNSVNSHKPAGTTMGGPYFGNAERDLFQYWRAR